MSGLVQARTRFIQAQSARQFGSMWHSWTDIDGRHKTVPHSELINGEWVETKEYKEMKKWSEL